LLNARPKSQAKSPFHLNPLLPISHPAPVPPMNFPGLFTDPFPAPSTEPPLTPFMPPARTLTKQPSQIPPPFTLLNFPPHPSKDQTVSLAKDLTAVAIPFLGHFPLLHPTIFLCAQKYCSPPRPPKRPSDPKYLFNFS